MSILLGWFGGDVTVMTLEVVVLNFHLPNTAIKDIVESNSLAAPVRVETGADIHQKQFNVELFGSSVKIFRL